MGPIICIEEESETVIAPEAAPLAAYYPRLPPLATSLSVPLASIGISASLLPSRNGGTRGGGRLHPPTAKKMFPYITEAHEGCIHICSRVCVCVHPLQHPPPSAVKTDKIKGRTIVCARPAPLSGSPLLRCTLRFTSARRYRAGFLSYSMRWWGYTAFGYCAFHVSSFTCE